MKKNLIVKSILITLFISLFISCSDDSDDNTVKKEDDIVNPGSGNSNQPSSYEKEIMKLINDFRKSKGLKELKILTGIKSQSDAHTEYMIKNNKLSHENFNDRYRFLRKSVDAKDMAENVSTGYTSAKAVVNAWIKSKGHYQNITGDYTHFYLTAKKDSKGSWWYTNIFIVKK